MTQEDLDKVVHELLIEEYGDLKRSPKEIAELFHMTKIGFKKALELLQKRRNNLSIDSTGDEDEAWTILLHPFTHLLD